MSRLSSANAPLRATPRPAAKVKSKKPLTTQDRLKTRTLFFRRVKRSIKPGLWVLAGIFAVAFVAQAVRAIPAAPAKIAPLHSSSSFARLAAAAGFRVANIKISGADDGARPAIQAALGISPGDPIFGVSIKDAAQRVAQVGSVRSAVIERELPATLIVTITQRAAFAIWQSGSGASAQYALIDRSGNIIANQNAVEVKRQDPDLLLVVGQGAAQHAAALQAQLNAFPSINQRIVAAEWVDGLRWNLTLKDQAVIKLPMNDVQTALVQLARLQTSLQLLDRPVEAIDMRLPGRMVVHPYSKDGASPPGNAAGHP
ncbi:MAG: cell division protein FtsQ/DivIB [Acidocella sp.]|nr:cell division protein FtsQ/DivIB [Acidocella sp.]